jgi:RNase P/RNase MRP subunit p29
VYVVNKRQRNPKGQSGMVNIETLSTFDIQDTGRRQSGMVNIETLSTLDIQDTGRRQST